MGATRSGTAAAGSSIEAGGDLIAAAVSLRWSRPDLTAALADHVLETVDALEERDQWLRAAGWAVHARSVFGDGRVAAAEILTVLAGGGAQPLMAPTAFRLRVELALLAVAAGEVDDARALLAPVIDAEPSAELRADAYCSMARCAAEDEPADVATAVRRAGSAWSEAPPARAAIGAAATALVSAATARRAGRSTLAVERASDGLERMGGGAASAHLTAALTAEWISALLDCGRVEEAHEGSAPLVRRLDEAAQPSRQGVRLRLTVARALATRSAAADATEQLEKAASEAALCNAPDLESVCYAALGALHEKAGRLEAALEAIQIGVAAQRRDQQRSALFSTTLRRALSEERATTPPRSTSTGGWVPTAESSTVEKRRSPVNGSSNGKSSRAARAAARSSAEREAEEQENAAMQGLSWLAEGAAPTLRDLSWDDPLGGSPIGDALARGTVENGSGNGNRSADEGRRHRRSADPWSTGRWTSDPTESGPERVTEKVAPVRPAPPASPQEHLASGTTRANGGKRRRDELEPMPEPSTGTAAAESEPESWLQSALAELDRVWGRPAASAPVSEPTPVESRPAESGPAPSRPAESLQASGREGCSVVIDVARESRRFAGRRAAAVVRAIADQLTDRLPPGARLRHDDADALSVLMPGWERTAATRWMHSTLPELMENFEAGEELPGAQLRVAVHDIDGLVGAQLLQRLDPPPRRPGIGFTHEPAHPLSSRIETEIMTAQEWRDLELVRAVEPAPVSAETPRTRGSAAGSGSIPEAGGRHGSLDQPQVPRGSEPVSAARGESRRHRRGGKNPAPEPTAEPAPSTSNSTDGLGLADLLAGALAAYRGI